MMIKKKKKKQVQKLILCTSELSIKSVGAEGERKKIFLFFPSILKSFGLFFFPLINMYPLYY